MVRKTVTIKNDILDTLAMNKIVEQYQSFSDMVSSALKLLIEQKEKEKYREAMIQASRDLLYLEDMKEIEDDFKYADFERNS